ncbi:GH25 family lysozyme [Hazenella coriacea]|uniref:GH25 family lysozyme n=1 Tax=Hazenella coriacea TaxID=1179467 RepID=UPI001FB43CC5|nr:GH25 family lysozyme [Hazenella coriacea]
MLSAILIIILLGVLDYFGIIWHNDLFAMSYGVKGLDVSHHQNKINWKVVQEENDFKFVYMKATEGKDFVDHRFAENWKEAQENGFLIGAYHFFSMQSTGEEQAANFTKIVPKQANSLPPVIDIEIALYHDQEKARKGIQVLADRMEQHYGKKPILYVTYDRYDRYVKGHFEGYEIWIRDIVKPPTLDERKWLIWQYSNRGRIDGIDTYVDINVFNGDLEQFNRTFSQ